MGFSKNEKFGEASLQYVEYIILCRIMIPSTYEPHLKSSPLRRKYGRRDSCMNLYFITFSLKKIYENNKNN